ncbi:hypothetical protein [Streptomyces sp. NPDC057386]|uniref:hypothetical protein n=1 Tax=unclassified Streptomyces TaxID=2593676 RepID=UPI003637B496
MTPDSEARSSWSASGGGTARRRDGIAEDDDTVPVAPADGEAFVITDAPEPRPRDPDTATLPGDPGRRTGGRAGGGASDDADGDGAGIWERLGDGRATAITAAAAGLVLLAVLLAMSLITDGVAFTSDRTEPAGGSTATAGGSTPPAGPPGGDHVPGAPAAPATPSAAPSDTASAAGPTRTPPGTGAPPGAGSTHDDEDDDHDDDDDDRDDDDHDHDDDLDDD